MIPWLEKDAPFPPVQRALKDPNGLLAAGGDLSPKRLLEGYRRGIFPWYSEGDPILWWSPDPRMVLFPAELKISRSLGKTRRDRRRVLRRVDVLARARRLQDRIGGARRASEIRRIRAHRLPDAHAAPGIPGRPRDA